MKKRTFYQGDPDKQPKNCGRPHPQPFCLCVLCEVYERFKNLEEREKELARLRAVKGIK